MSQGNQNQNHVVSNVDEFIIESPEDDPTYDKLNNLVKVLENDIRRVHNNSIDVEKTIMSIRNSAYESSVDPRGEHLSLLYCHISEEMKQQKTKNQDKLSSLNYHEQDDVEDDNNSDTVSLMGDIPFYLYSGSSKQIVGREALNRNVFYSRAATALFSFLAFVIMSCVPHIGWRYVDPKYLLEVVSTMSLVSFVHLI